MYCCEIMVVNLWISMFLFTVPEHISIHADVYAPYRNTIQHITPYTTWVIRVFEDRSGDIDLSQVTRIAMRLDGSAISNNFKKDEKEEALWGQWLQGTLWWWR